MCQCGTNNNTPPANNNGGAPANNPVTPCPGSQSAILLMDEIGLPMKGVSVKVTIDGAQQSMSTDDQGRICFSKPPGTSVVVELNNTQESKVGESTSTTSGKHFGLNKPGP